MKFFLLIVVSNLDNGDVVCFHEVFPLNCCKQSCYALCLFS